MQRGHNWQERELENDKRSRRSENGRLSRKSSRKEAIKVVYISTPMNVTICSSKFREIVQQLTRPESDVARFMEICERDSWKVSDDHYNGH
uniref:VQ domain-containing protein n=1 Tax=Chenopodium quinoa TaxID=63459 RepID=A0A803NCB6_CHEQI